ncbi:ABC transporter ATP-binding protein [Clostridium sp. UBA1353]|uniref:ABC transporter ATP-binding protein n=1 Tax=Clostridium sp. UBA1353 TaxID=1946347 RepID=UPI0032175463
MNKENIPLLINTSNKFGMYKYVFKYLKTYKFKIIIMLALSIFVSIISIIDPYIVSVYMDTLIYNIENLNIQEFVLVIVILNLLDLILKYISNIIMVIVSNKAVFNMIYDIFEHIKRLSIEYLRSKDMVYLNQRVNTDCNEIIMFVINNILNIFLNAITIIVISIMIININFKISLTLFSVIPLYFICYSFYKKKLYKYSNEVKEIQNVYFSRLTDQLKSIRMIKLNSCFNFFSELMIDSFNRFFKKNLRASICNSNFNAFGNVISSISTLILLFMGFYEIYKGNLTIGEFLVFNNLFPLLIQNIDYFFQLGSNYQKALASYNRIVEILNEKEEINGVKNINSIDTIKCKNINYSFGEQSVIKNFNFEFEKGNIYKIYGLNGKGKTTLINIIAGLYSNHDGKIFYNNIDINELDIYNLRKYNFAISEQEPRLITDSILNNISLGNNDIDKSCILDYMNTFNVKRFSLDYLISEDNINISGGEKQKISLIKCLCKNSDVIILDEPTSALDSESIEKLKDILVKVKKEKIILLVAHGDFGVDISDKEILI